MGSLFGATQIGRGRAVSNVFACRLIRLLKTYAGSGAYRADAVDVHVFIALCLVASILLLRLIDCVGDPRVMITDERRIYIKPFALKGGQLAGRARAWTTGSKDHTSRREKAKR